MKSKYFFNRLIIFFAVVAIVGYCFTPAFAEMDNENSVVQEEFGFDEPGPDLQTSDGTAGTQYQSTWIPMFRFVPASSGLGYQYANNYGWVYCTSVATTDPWFYSSIRLPSGAYLSGIRFYYYDNHSGYARMAVYHDNAGATTGNLLGQFNSVGTPGRTSYFMSINQTINNYNGFYGIFLSTSAASSSLQLQGVRLWWRRQIRTGLSHPFNDIGSLPQQFRDSIAALYHSGITTGTTPTTFSPYSNLTRAQMAVFLSRALGLYWNE